MEVDDFTLEMSLVIGWEVSIENANTKIKTFPFPADSERPDETKISWKSSVTSFNPVHRGLGGKNNNGSVKGATIQL